MATGLEKDVLGGEDEEKKVKLEEGKCDRYSPALEGSEDVKSEVKHEIKAEAQSTLPKKEEDSDTKDALKLEAKTETPSLVLDPGGTLPETLHAAPSETTSTVSATEGVPSDLELTYPSTPRSPNVALLAPQISTLSSPLIDTKIDVKTEGEVKLETGVKAEVDPQPGLVKVEAKLEAGDDVPSGLLKEEEGVKRETKDEIPSAMALDLPLTPTNKERASIEPPEHLVEAAAAGLAPDSSMDLAATDPLPDVPAADVGEPVDPAIKPEPTDIDPEPVPVPVRKRKFMLCVEVPSLESVMKRYKKWEQTIVKKPKKEAAISLKTLAGRYEALGVREPYNIPLDIEIRDIAVSRQLISSIYGGNVQQTFPTPSAKFLAIHGINDFMCLNYILQPNAPTLPGSPGFYFNPGSEHAIDAHRHLFAEGDVKRLIMQLGPSRWLYLGQYVPVPSESLTPEEWKAQSSGFRRLWVTYLMTRGWAEFLRSRVLLRKRLGRLPTNREVKDAMDSTQNFGSAVTAEDIEESFANGDHFIAVWGMKCVGYDTAFQKRLVEEAAKQAAAGSGEGVKKEEKKEKKPKATKRKRRAPSPDVPKKRSRKDSPSDPEGDSKPLEMEVDADIVEVVERPSAIVQNDDDDDDEVQIVKGPVLLKKKVYTPRGTRSRPSSAKVIVID
ncbi:hypothetical protein EYR38_004933 [Pleurotus pulmonarius]|nr:hypothetical protein EYR38_004933 [Pleurotus pulmonarius]